MSIFKRGRVWHYEFQYRSKRYRGSTEETSKAKAKEVEALKRVEAKLGRQTKDFTLKEAALSWWDLKARFLKSAHNIDEGLKVIDRLMDMDLKLSQITTHTLVETVARRRGEVTQFGKPPSNATVNREIPYNVRRIFRHAVEVMGATDVPSIAWSQVVLTKPKPRPRDFTEAERAAILKHLPERYHALHAFYSLYGVRWREAFFPLDRIDLDAGRVALRERKGGDWHTIPLTEEDRRLMAARVSRAQAAGLNTVWFYEDRLGRLCPIPPRSFRTAMKRALTAANIDARAVHDLRHDAAMSGMRRSKGNIAAVKKLLGHENIQATQIYAHATEQDVRDILGESPQNPHTDTAKHDKKSTGTED